PRIHDANGRRASDAIDRFRPDRYFTSCPNLLLSPAINNVFCVGGCVVGTRFLSLIFLAFGGIASWAMIALPTAAAANIHVRFDIPDKIECRDVTPEKCAIAHPTLKVIEAKFRISARIMDGAE